MATDSLFGDKSLEQLQTEYKALGDQIKRKQEEGKKTAIEEIKAKMAEFGITVDDLGKTAKVKEKKPKMIRYKDDSTGIVWAGRGRKPPEWSKLSKEELEKFKLATPLPA